MKRWASDRDRRGFPSWSRVGRSLRFRLWDPRGGLDLFLNPRLVDGLRQGLWVGLGGLKPNRLGEFDNVERPEVNPSADTGRESRQDPRVEPPGKRSLPDQEHSPKPLGVPPVVQGGAKFLENGVGGVVGFLDNENRTASGVEVVRQGAFNRVPRRGNIAVR